MKALRRISASLLSMWVVTTVVFVVTHKLGDPAVLLLPVGASDADLSILRQQLGLDLPLWRQYIYFIGGLSHGHLGQSFLFLRPAMGVVWERMSATLTLATTSLALALTIGCGLGCILAVSRGVFRSFSQILVLLGQSIPVFVLGLLLIQFFSVHLGLLPTGGRGGWRHLLLPSISLAAIMMSQIARMTEAAIEQVQDQPYVLNARAKGLRRHTIFFWYVLRNALIPIVTLVGLLAGELVGGTVVAETVFAWPGVGRLTFQAIQNGDYPLVSAAVIVSSFAVIFANLFVDMIYLYLDPRARRTV